MDSGKEAPCTGLSGGGGGGMLCGGRGVMDARIQAASVYFKVKSKTIVFNRIVLASGQMRPGAQKKNKTIIKKLFCKSVLLRLTHSDAHTCMAGEKHA